MIAARGSAVRAPSVPVEAEATASSSIVVEAAGVPTDDNGARRLRRARPCTIRVPSPAECADRSLPGRSGPDICASPELLDTASSQQVQNRDTPSSRISRPITLVRSNAGCDIPRAARRARPAPRDEAALRSPSRCHERLIVPSCSSRATRARSAALARCGAGATGRGSNRCRAGGETVQKWRREGECARRSHK